MSVCLKSSLIALCVISVLIWEQTARAEEAKPVVVVFDLQVQRFKLDSSLRESLSDYLSVRLAETGRYQVVPRADVKKRLTGQKKETLKECYDQSCQIDLGRELAAQLTVSTRIAKLGSRCKLSLAVFDLRKATTEKAVTVSGSCSEDGLVASLDQAVVKLAGKAAQPAPLKEEPQEAGLIPAPDQPVQIISALSDKCVDVKKKSRKNGAAIHQYGCTKKPNQLWLIIPGDQKAYQLRSVLSGKCLEVPGKSRKQNVQLEQYRCKKVPNQLWRVTDAAQGRVRISSVNSNKCMDLKGQSLKNKAAIQQHSCKEQSNQLWKLVKP